MFFQFYGILYIEYGDFMMDLFYEIMKEAKNGKAVIDNEVWPIGFNSVIIRKGKLLMIIFPLIIYQL